MSDNKSGEQTSMLGRLLGRFALIERHEVAAVVAAFCLFFFVMGGYFAVRPVRETVGTILGRDRVADLYVATWIASLAIVPIYGLLVAKFRRSVFLPAIYGFVALSLALVGFALQGDEENVVVGQFFYVFISVLNLFMVSVFWSFLVELFNSGQSKRLFGIIAAGGTAGALIGPFITYLVVGAIGNSGVLFLGAAMFTAAIVCQRALLRIWARGGTQTGEAQGGRQERAIGGNPFAGFTLLLRSPYLLGIALFVVLLAAVNTLLYFEQLRLVEEAFPDTADRTRVFATLDWVVQTLTILSQVFLTGRIATRLGVTVLLSVVPVMMVLGFLILAGANTFMALAVIFVLRRAGEYAFVRPGREILWSSLDRETKYKAKNVIDVPVYRGSDALVAQVTSGLGAGGTSPAGIALLGAGVAAAWAVNGWWLGRRHEQMAATSGTADHGHAAHGAPALETRRGG